MTPQQTQKKNENNRSKQNPIPKITKPKEKFKNPLGKKNEEEKQDSVSNCSLANCSPCNEMEMQTPETHTSASPLLYFYFKN
jgi:hypothetical protein